MGRMPGERGQSELIGSVLVIGLSILIALGTLSVGALVLDDTTSELEADRAEQALSRLSSASGLVAFGDRVEHGVDLGEMRHGAVSVREDAGRLTITIEGEDGTEEEIYNATMGAVVYSNGNTEVAYQGGGVWRQSGGGSTMVAPPEFHYRDLTLTLPMVRVTGDGTATGQVRSEIRIGGVAPVYPDVADGWENPVINETVYVTIETPYYEGWYRHFERSAEGSATLDHENQSVTIDLTALYSQHYDHVLAGQSIEMVPNSNDPPDPSLDGVSYPSMSEAIDDAIADCEDAGCATFPADGTVTAGTYFITDDVDLDHVFDTSDGEIEIVVDGDLDGGELEITGTDQVTFYVRGDLTLSGQDAFNEGGNATQLVTYVHSDETTVTTGGNTHYTGIIYAPNSDVTLNGGGADVNFRGALVGDAVTVNGEPQEFEYDDAVGDVEIGADGGFAGLTFLHISEHEVVIEVS